jgi:hypothetical protein
MRLFGLSAVFLAAVCVQAATPCTCDASHPETLKARECSLCAEAEKQPATPAVFFLKDANPRKPNRMLALPRHHTSGLHPLADLDGPARLELWTAAIAKAKELWGDDWAVAYNGDKVRTQCHAHIHIGKLLPAVEAGKFIEISSPAQIPAPTGDGFWIHPTADGKMHVHTGEQITETVLLR